MKTVWCLFSIENQYDQPSNNLEAVWLAKPTLEELEKVLQGAEKEEVEHILINNGDEVRIWNSDYRLQQVVTGEIIE